MKHGVISVVVPVYNVEKYLAECIESIIGQTYTNLEIILIDDSSPDRCGEICDRYARMDSRIIVIHQKNGGAAAARNAGLRIATGDFWPVEDPDKLDALRKSVGLMPIGEYLEMVKQQGVEMIYDKTKAVKDFK